MKDYNTYPFFIVHNDERRLTAMEVGRTYLPSVFSEYEFQLRDDGSLYVLGFDRGVIMREPVSVLFVAFREDPKYKELMKE